MKSNIVAYLSLITLAFLVVTIHSAQTTKTWNYLLYSEGARTKYFDGSSWITQTNYNPVMSDYTNTQCVDVIDTIPMGFGLTESTIIRRFWLDLRSYFSTGCTLTIKASASGAATNIIYSNSTFVASGTRDISLSINTAYKYFTIESVDSMALPCMMCGIEMFSG
jgi:hypothetical protein